MIYSVINSQTGYFNCLKMRDFGEIERYPKSLCLKNTEYECLNHQDNESMLNVC